MDVVDLKSCVTYIRNRRNRSRQVLDSITVSATVKKRIMKELREMSPVGPGPRPPDGHPDQWLYDEARNLEKRAEIRILGVRIDTLSRSP